MEWHTIVKGNRGGTQFHTGALIGASSPDRRVQVRRIFWQKPGFSGRTSTGWALFIDDEQYGPAHQTATRAMRHAELPGVWADIQRKLDA